MTSYVVDSWAWIEYLEGSSKGARVRDIVEGGSDTLTHVVSIAEIVSRVERVGKDSQAAAARVASLSKLIAPSMADAVEAGALHAEMRKRRSNFSLADAFVLQAARSKAARVLTGDPDFKGINEAEVVG